MEYIVTKFEFSVILCFGVTGLNGMDMQTTDGWMAPFHKTASP